MTGPTALTENLLFLSSMIQSASKYEPISMYEDHIFIVYDSVGLKAGQPFLSGVECFVIIKEFVIPLSMYPILKSSIRFCSGRYIRL